LNTLSAVFSFGESEEVGWTDRNPVHKVKRRPEPEGRVRFLSRPADESKSELERLLAACRTSRNKDLIDLVQLGILTGMREGEILGLRRSQVRLNEGGITLTADVTKGGESRFVPLVGPVLAMVTRRFETSRDYLFAPRRHRAPLGAPRFPRTAWRNAVRKAGIKNFRFHDLRHTHGSYLAMTGASIRELMDALGHKTPDTAVRYSHLADLHRREVAERVLDVGREIFR
jgi:integrase